MADARVRTPIGTRTHPLLLRTLTIGLGVFLSIGAVALSPTVAHAAIPEVRTPLILEAGTSHPVTVNALAVTPNRVVGVDTRAGSSVMPTAWTRSVSRSGFGPETDLSADSNFLGASGSRTATVTGQGARWYDAGTLTSEMAGQQLTGLTGPYGIAKMLRSDGSWTEVVNARGDQVTRVNAFVGFFGSRYVSVSKDADPSGSMHLTVKDITEASAATTVDLPPGTAACSAQDSLWGDTMAVWCGADGSRLYSVTTGQLLGSMPETVFTVGDGYVIAGDWTGTRFSYQVRTFAGAALGDFSSCTGVPATDGVGHVVCATATELIWRDFSSISTSAARVLGWLAPSTFSSGTWAPQVDATKPFDAGVLRIRQGSTVIKDIAVPASADGSLRGVSWDGKTTGGTVASTGVYTAELVVSGTDGSGAVKAVDGVSAPTFDVGWTGPGLTTGLPGSYVPLSPSRLLDTRTEFGGSGPVAANASVTLQVTGRGGVPSTGVGAVILNVTAVTPKAPGFLTVYPAGTSAPNASNLNFVAGQIAPNLVVAKLSAGGQVSIKNGSAGATEVVVDVAGYCLGGTVVDAGGLTAVTPSRLLDTRPSMGGTGAASGQTRTRVQVTGRGGVPASGISAAVVNLTAVDTTSSGYLTAFPTNGVVPNASNVNFVAGQVVPNLAIVKLDADGSFTILNGSGGSTDLVVDVVGYVADGVVTGSGMYVPLSPSRILETRPDYGGAGPVASFGVKSLTVTGAGGVPATGVSGVVMNVTVVAGNAPGYVTVYPADVAAPVASNLNFTPGLVVPNLVAVKTSAAGAVTIRNASASANNFVVDVSGYFTG